jgi:hypothetical protein
MIHWLNDLFYFFMRRMLPATLAEFLQLQPIRSGLPVLRGRIIPLFTITALDRNNFSGHEKSSWLLALGLKPNCHPEGDAFCRRRIYVFLVISATAQSR